MLLGKGKNEESSLLGLMGWGFFAALQIFCANFTLAEAFLTLLAKDEGRYAGLSVSGTSMITLRARLWGNQ